MRHIRHSIDFLKRFARDRRGATLVEFAFVVPVLTFLTLASVELSRYVLLNQKLQNAATSLADLAARGRTLSVTQLDSMFAAVPSITQPYDFTTQGVAIVTSITAVVANDPEVAWQRSGGGALVEASQIGLPGNNASIPAALPTRAGDTIIAAEVYFDFVPLFDILLGPRTLYRSAFVRPRLGTLTTLTP
jgi:Flp pilus assembly protein TadG